MDISKLPVEQGGVVVPNRLPTELPPFTLSDLKVRIVSHSVPACVNDNCNSPRCVLPVHLKHRLPFQLIAFSAPRGAR
jgi:hypothetical protein